MNSSTGTAQTHVAGDQRNAPKGSDAPARYEAGQTNAHDIHDPKDSLKLNDRAKIEQKQEAEEDERVRERANRDPTAPAKEHGNRPSRGAEIDKQLQEEDELRLQEKGQA
ncbi:hypothetical protein BC835DRAFT_1415169 [Cytidiella melzeri]|nr:hypothetical protein BC835DRAFT_1415169 [Cytidiella melzeri]